jgi:Icc-related predicted phosphoesterase
MHSVRCIHNRLHRISQIKKQIELKQPDILIIAGDVTSYFRKVSVLLELNELSIPVLMIRGNSDLKKVDKIVEGCSNIESLHFNIVEKESIRFIGVNGTVPLPFNSKICLNEGQVLSKLSNFMVDNTVLVAHTPPKGVLDRVLGKFHAGSRMLRDFLDKNQPALYLCGHIHEDPGISYIGKTPIINCSIGRAGNGSLIDITETGICSLQML